MAEFHNGSQSLRGGRSHVHSRLLGRKRADGQARYQGNGKDPPASAGPAGRGSNSLEQALLSAACLLSLSGLHALGR